MAWYSNSNGRVLPRQTQAQYHHEEEYPYEDHHHQHTIRSQVPTYMVDGGQRKSSTTSYPTPTLDHGGPNNYVLKTERVVEVYRPVVTRRVFVNGKPVKQERYVGAFEEDGDGDDDDVHNNLRKVQDFFNQVQMEASVPPVPLLSRPAPNLRAKTMPTANWGSGNDRPNWGRRASWMTSRDDNHDNDSHHRPTRPIEHFVPNPTHHMSYYDNDSPPRYNQRQELSCRPDSTPNWPSWSSRSSNSPVRSSSIRPSHSPVRSSSIRPSNSPVRSSSIRPSNSPVKSSVRPNWQTQSGSPPRVVGYDHDRDHDHDHQYHPNSRTSPDWPKTRDRDEYSPIKPNWPTNRDQSSPPKLNRINPGTKPDWLNARDDDSPRKSKGSPKVSPLHSKTRPNYFGDEDDDNSVTLDEKTGKDRRNTSSPIHKQLERASIRENNHDREPIPKTSNDNNNNEISHKGIKDSSNQRPNWPSKKGQDEYEDPYKKPPNSEPKPYMIDNNSMSKSKPNFNGGQQYKDDYITGALEEAKRTGGYTGNRPRQERSTTPQWNEITPNPPPLDSASPHAVIIDSTEANRRYAPPPATYYARAGYFGALTAEDAVRKYGGTFLPK